MAIQSLQQSIYTPQIAPQPKCNDHNILTCAEEGQTEAQLSAAVKEREAPPPLLPQECTQEGGGNGACRSKDIK